MAPPTNRNSFAVYGTLLVKPMAIGIGVPEEKVEQISILQLEGLVLT